MKTKIIVILLILLLHLETAVAAENDYGIVKAWFDGKNATVEGIQMKIGEPVEVKVEVISKINGDVSLKLKEPGVTKAFNVLNGPSKTNEWIESKIESNWSRVYTWMIAPNGAWKNGNAPINIFVQFNKGMDNKIVQFTIANPYILDEQYSGAAPTTAPSPQPTGTGSAAPTKQAPFVPAVVALSALILAWRWRREKS